MTLPQDLTLARHHNLSSILAIVAALWLGLGCWGGVHLSLPVCGHHHHAPGTADPDGALAVHGACCVTMSVPASYRVAALVRSQPVTWLMPVETTPAERGVSSEPRPPKHASDRS